MGARTLINSSQPRVEPTLFDLPAAPRAAVTSLPRRSTPRPRPSPQRLSTADEHPDAGQRFDVFFTHEQMVALNAVTLMAYERWGIRVNKSQLLRALVDLLDASGPELKELIETMPVNPLPAPPPKAADANVHRQFESKLASLLQDAIRAIPA